MIGKLTHLERGKASMVDVGEKPVGLREAVAFGEIALSPEFRGLLGRGRSVKGDIFGVARVAAILAAKRVDELIPLCHTLALDSVAVSFLLEPGRLVIRAVARAKGRTGVEMEALTAVSVAALTVYDMVKSAAPGIVIGPVFLGRKTGGRSHYVRKGIPSRWFPESVRARELPWR